MTKIKKEKKEKKKKSFRRFNRWFSFLIILTMALFVFWKGWIQNKIGEDEAGLVFTKLTYPMDQGGFDTEITTNDGFHWRWENIIPTNLTLYLYPLSPRTVQVSSQGTLPSGDIYLSFIEEQDQNRFNWDLSFELTYRLNSQLIPDLAIKKGIIPDSIEDFFASEQGSIERELYNYLKDFDLASNPDQLKTVEISIQEKHPFVEILSLSPQKVVLPDLVLYEKSRDLYFAFLDQRNSALEEMISQVAPKTAVNDEKMQIMEEYGKLLTQYPILIDFFALDNENEFGYVPPGQLMPEKLDLDE